MLPFLENRRPRLQFLVAIPIFVAAAGFRVALLAILGTRVPYVTFFPAVMLAAIFGGPYAGFMVTILSTLFAAYYLMEPVGQIFVSDFGDWVGIIIFLLSCLMVCWLSESTRRARKRASQAEAQVELAAERERAGAALAESEAKFRSYMESSPIALFVVDKDGHYLDFNAATTVLLGYTADTFAGMDILEVHPVEDHSAVIRQFCKLFETGRMEMETRLLRADGLTVWVSLHAARLNSGHAIIYCQDISGQKEAVSSMRERLALQEQLATITAVAPGVIYSFRLRPDGSSCVPYASPALENIYGLQPAEVVEDAAAVFALIYPEDREQVNRSMEQSARSLTPWRAEFRVRHPRRGEIWVEGHSMPNKEVDGSILWQGFLLDVTARKRTEEMVLETSRRLELATRSGGIGVWDWNIATGTLHWNERMFELYGITPHSFDGSIDAWIAAVHPDDRALARAAAEAAVSGEKDYDTEFRVVQSDGRLKILKSDAVVVRDEEGHPLRLIGLNRDITEQRQLASRLLQAQKMEALGRMAGGVAHDFNNNITVILGYTELSRHAEVNCDKFREYLDEISQAAEHSRDVTQQLLAFSRHEMVTPRRVDLNQLIRQAEKTLLRLIGGNIQFRLSTPEGIWPVLIDPAQFNQVIIHLAANARDAMPFGGTLSIGLKNVLIAAKAENCDLLPGEYVRIKVTDTGVGMDRETQGRVFEPFYTTKEVGKGTGLGLATVYGIMSQNGGCIRLHSEPGEGAAFTLFLPRTAPQEAREPGEPQVPTTAAGDACVLLVEDEEGVRRMARLMLERSGYSVLVAASPREALAICSEERGRIDCLLTDVIMPGMSGVELSVAVRAICPGIGILFMSGYTADMIAHHGVLEQGVVFLQKPFDVTRLQEKVEQAMRSPRHC